MQHISPNFIKGLVAIVVVLFAGDRILGMLADEKRPPQGPPPLDQGAQDAQFSKFMKHRAAEPKTKAVPEAAQVPVTMLRARRGQPPTAILW